jgi:hypothetical protein
MMKFYSEGALRILATPTFLSMITVTSTIMTRLLAYRKELTDLTHREVPAGQGFSADYFVEKLRSFVDFREAI